MKLAFTWMVVGSLVTNAAWIFRARIGSWFVSKEKQIELNLKGNKTPPPAA